MKPSNRSVRECVFMCHSQEVSGLGPNRAGNNIMQQLELELTAETTHETRNRSSGVWDAFITVVSMKL